MSWTVGRVGRVTVLVLSACVPRGPATPAARAAPPPLMAVPTVPPPLVRSDNPSARSPEPLEDAVVRALRAMLGDPGLDIQVTAHASTVTLAGTLPSAPLVWAAHEAAAAVEGVSAIVDELVVESEAGSDQELAGRVSVLLASDPATSTQGIKARSHRHIITLDGQASTDALAARARDLAIATRGVSEVVDRLRPIAAHVPRPAELRSAVEQRAAELGPPGSPVAVEVTSEGGVVLSGRVPRAEQRRDIIAAAWAAGAAGVDDRSLTVAWWTGRVSPDWRPPTRSDASLGRALADTFRLDERFAPFSLEAVVEDHAAILRGRVPTAGLRRAAEAMARLLPGISGVRSRLRVSPALLASNDALLGQVRARLERDPFLDSRTIDVRVQGRAVLLQGSVDDAGDDTRAQFVAAGVPGVTFVESRLVVRGGSVSFAAADFREPPGRCASWPGSSTALPLSAAPAGTPRSQ
jgi:osmotically-inducible protein OsmY